MPIFKGRSSSGGHHKTRKPYDSKNQWSPNFSAERRNYDGSSGRAGGSSYYPQYPTYNYPGAEDTRGGSVSIYRTADGWTNYVPMWTTERAAYSEHYRPNSVPGHGSGPTWKPCYCLTSAADNRRRRDSTRGVHAVVKSTSPVIQVVDGKLDGPFSN